MWKAKARLARAASQRRVNEAGSPGRIRRWNFRFSTAPARRSGLTYFLAHAQCPIELGNAGHYGRDGEVSGEAGQVQGTSAWPANRSRTGRRMAGRRACVRGACQPLEARPWQLALRVPRKMPQKPPKARHSHGGYATHDMLTQRICDCATATVSKCIQTGFGGDDQRRETRRASFLADMRLGDEGMLSQDCFDGRQSDALSSSLTMRSMRPSSLSPCGRIAAASAVCSRPCAVQGESTHSAPSSFSPAWTPFRNCQASLPARVAMTPVSVLP